MAKKISMHGFLQTENDPCRSNNVLGRVKILKDFAGSRP